MTTILPPIEPEYCTSPGESLAMTLEDMDMPQKELARRIGFTEKAVSELINNKTMITPATAEKLELVTGTPAVMWIAKERYYREWKAFNDKAKDKEYMKQVRAFLKGMPYRELTDRDFCRNYSRALYKTKDLLSFFGVSGMEEYENTYKEICAAACAGHSQQRNPKAFSAWVRIGEIRLRGQNMGTIESAKLKEAVKYIRGLVTMHPREAWAKIVSLLAENGVFAIIVPELKATHVAGFARHIPGKKKAILQLSLRGKTIGSFWFNLFHELGHLVLHGKKQVFINEGIEARAASGACSKEEQEADAFAADTLIPPAEWKKFTASTRQYTVESIQNFANSLSIPAEIVSLRLLIEKKLPQDIHAELKTPLRPRDFATTADSEQTDADTKSNSEFTYPDEVEEKVHEAADEEKYE